MSKTNTAIKIVPQTDEEVAQMLKELRKSKQDLEDSIKYYSNMLLDRAAQRQVKEFQAGTFTVKIVHKKRQNFSLKEASEKMDPETYMSIIMPFTTESEWDEVHVK